MTDAQHAALLARIDYLDACLHELLRRLPGEGYWRPGDALAPLVQAGGDPAANLPVALTPATVVYPSDTTTPRPSVSGPDTNLEWAKQHPEEARALSLRMTARMVGADPES